MFTNISITEPTKIVTKLYNNSELELKSPNPIPVFQIKSKFI